MLAAVFLVSVPAVWLAVDPTLARIFWHAGPDYDDFRIFANRTLAPSPTPFHFAERLGSFRPGPIHFRGRILSLEHFLAEQNTLAFLVIQDDTLVYEHYFQGARRSSKILAFSASKSFSSLLVGIALEEKRIRAIDQPITDLIPELGGRGFSKVSLENVLDSTSGIDWHDTGFPTDPQPHLYYSPDVVPILLGLRLAEAPGTRFAYKSADNQLLALALHRALGKTTIADYFQQKLWTPMGMEFEGSFSLDREGGLEKTFCCLAARPIDLAKFGRLVMRGGDWDGARLISSKWFERAASQADKPFVYRHQWWLPSPGRRDVLASGLMGQFVYVDPPTRSIIVRLGSSRFTPEAEEWVGIFRQVLGQ